MKLIVKTFHGLEDVLASELKNLMATNVQALNRAVSCDGGIDLLYRINHLSRTALRVLKPIHSFKARNERQLYARTMEYDWSSILNLKKTFAIDSVVYSELLKHSKFAALKVKDAIADQFRKKTGKRPDVETAAPDIRIHLHIAGDIVTISLDSSGNSLHKRGYREVGHAAPLNESLAAGMLKLSAWNKITPLIDPMCGSGTFLMEAAMIACQIPPGLLRTKYCFMNWPDFDDNLWKEIIEKSKEQVKALDFEIRGSDISPKAMDTAFRTIAPFDWAEKISLKRASFFKLEKEFENGMIIMNPPYGERLKSDDITALYKKIGDTLKFNFSGFEAWILSSNATAIKSIGLRPSQKTTLYNGSLECKFQQFSLYKGSKKNF